LSFPPTLSDIRSHHSHVIYKDIKNKAAQWLNEDGKVRYLKNAFLTLEQYPIKQFVAVQDKNMKAAWFLVGNTELKASEVIKAYAKRWKIEPYFRDLKDSRYGFGLESTHIKSCDRRDKLLLILALSYTLITLLGEAGEKIGFDKKLKVNTVKTRTHSLFRQGQFYYKYFYRFTQEEQELLMDKFHEVLSQLDFWGNLLGDSK
jgi:transposase